MNSNARTASELTMELAPRRPRQEELQQQQRQQQQQRHRDSDPNNSVIVPNPCNRATNHSPAQFSTHQMDPMVIKANSPHYQSQSDDTASSCKFRHHHRHHRDSAHGKDIEEVALTRQNHHHNPNPNPDRASSPNSLHQVKVVPPHSNLPINYHHHHNSDVPVAVVPPTQIPRSTSTSLSYRIALNNNHRDSDDKGIKTQKSFIG